MLKSPERTKCIVISKDPIRITKEDIKSGDIEQRLDVVYDYLPASISIGKHWSK